jgi:two-component system response regulator HydG
MKRGIITISDSHIIMVPSKSVWMTQFEIADLFEVFSCDIRKAIHSIYKNDEADKTETMQYVKLPNGTSIDTYNIEIVIAVAFRIRSRNSSIFRKFVADNLKKAVLTKQLRQTLEVQIKKAERRTSLFKRESEAFRNVYSRAAKVAKTDLGVLITGESETGKEHIAEKIHCMSEGLKGRLVCVDCGSLTNELAAAAFFGYEKGAFTGATEKRGGFLQEADEGTLFLDEVANLGITSQQILLRALQERRYRPIGAKGERATSFRIIAATNENLPKAIVEGRFREDLYHRINEWNITLPPLRECKEDILPMAEFFLAENNLKFGRHASLDASARKVLQAYPWPGNVRKLSNRIRSATIETDSGIISADTLKLNFSKIETQVDSFALNDDRTERERIERALKQADGNRSMAAGLLEISRGKLYTMMKKHGIE